MAVVRIDTPRAREERHKVSLAALRRALRAGRAGGGEAAVFSVTEDEALALIGRIPGVKATTRELTAPISSFRHFRAKDLPGMKECPVAASHARAVGGKGKQHPEAHVTPNTDRLRSETIPCPECTPRFFAVAAPDGRQPITRQRTRRREGRPRRKSGTRADARTVSLRLDEEARHALETLMIGKTRSAAIRDALIEAAGRRRRTDLAAEAAALAADPEDVAEMQEVAALMESLRAEG